jgi:hypothetical protein
MDPIYYLLDHTDPVVVVVSLFLVDRIRRLASDLKSHMVEEKKWREDHDQWRIEHITDHS